MGGIQIFCTWICSLAHINILFKWLFVMFLLWLINNAIWDCPNNIVMVYSYRFRFRFVHSFFVFLCEHPLKYFFNPLGRPELITWKNSVLAVCWKYKRGMNIVGTPFLLEGGGGWTSYQIFKKGRGLTGPLFLEVGWWERGTWSFRGGRGCNFYTRDKYKIWNI